MSVEQGAGRNAGADGINEGLSEGLSEGLNEGINEGINEGDDWDFPRPHLLAVSPQAADIDGLDHTNNAVYVQWCERVAWSHSEHLGLSLQDYRQLDRAMAIRQGVYDYLLPSFEGERLWLGTWLTAGDGKLAMERRFQLRRASDGQTLMRGRWDLVCIEISTGRPRRMPPAFVQVYQAAVVAAEA